MPDFYLPQDTAKLESLAQKSNVFSLFKHIPGTQSLQILP